MKRFPGLFVLPPLLGLLLAAGCEDKVKFSAGERPAGDANEMTGVAFPGEGGKVPLNSDNTHITFIGSKKSGQQHNGGFKKVDGVLKLENLSPGQTPKARILEITVNIEADSLFADPDQLANHLKSNDFFAVKENPKITFQSTKTANVPETGHSKVNITGDLTIRSVTKPVSFVLTVTQDRFLFVTGEFEINRRDFGVANPKDAEINDKVSVKVEVGKPSKK
jgi:polyisoprenoid-binding protein YceI